MRWLKKGHMFKHCSWGFECYMSYKGCKRSAQHNGSRDFFYDMSISLVHGSAHPAEHVDSMAPCMVASALLRAACS